jgi:hypothetical protein
MTAKRKQRGKSALRMRTFRATWRPSPNETVRVWSFLAESRDEALDLVAEVIPVRPVDVEEVR